MPTTLSRNNNIITVTPTLSSWDLPMQKYDDEGCEKCTTIAT
jgi:hypothetical protein